MVDYREILRMKGHNYSQRQIEASVKSSRHTIRDILEEAQRAGISWPLDANVTNEQLQAALFPGKASSASGRLEPDYGYIHRELAKPGVKSDAAVE